MKHLLSAIGAAATLLGGHAAAQPKSITAPEAFSRAAVDFCAALFEGASTTTPETLAASGVTLQESTPASQELFRGATEMRGFYALPPSDQSAAYVDGLISGEVSRCAIRLINAPRGHQSLVSRLEASGSGWKRLTSPEGTTEHYDLFLRELPGKPFDLLINVSSRPSGEPGPDGMTAFALVARTRKGGR